MRNGKIILFKPTRLDSARSMHIYADSLCGSLKKNAGYDIEEFSIKGVHLGPFKDVLSKDIVYPVMAFYNRKDVNHITDHSYGALAYLLDPKRTIVTCHDLNPLICKGQAGFLGRKRFLYNIKGMLRAGTIIVDSRSTGDILKGIFNYKGNIHVVYPGINGIFKKISDSSMVNDLKKKYALNKNVQYVIHVGSSYPVKNMETVLKVITEYKDAVLIKVGPFSRQQERYIAVKGISERILRFNDVDMRTLMELYNISDVMLMPSIAEGFGLPLAEAMACGLPVICSNCTSLPEVGGDAPIYVDLYNTGEMINALILFRSDKDVYTERSRRGIERAAMFTWEKAAKNVCGIYNNIRG